MTREQAYDLMTEMIKNPNLRKHGVAVEAIMRALCKYLRDRETNNSHPGGEHNEPIGSNLKDSITPTSSSFQNDNEFDEEEWAVVGLLHDADYELIEKDVSRHTLVTEQMLRERGFDNERIIQAIKAHHDGIKESRDNLLESSVYAADELSGLITAVALVRPDKKLESVDVDSVMKKFKQPSFAAGANREQIKACEKELGIPLEEFIGIGLKAMQEISDELGL